MAKPADGLPNAAEKGKIISALALKGITGIGLAAIADKTRKEVSDLTIARIREMKGL